MRARSLGERNSLPDHRTQRSILQSRDQSGVHGLIFLLGSVHERHPADVGFAAHGITRINLDWSAASNYRNSAFLGEHYKILAEILICQQFHDDVHATAIG